MPPTIAIKTIGCRLNQAESARLAGGFAAAGYAVVPFGAPCDACVIHGCTVTLRAERDSLRAARAARRAAPGALVVMAGCPAEVLGAALRGAAPVDLVVGQAAKPDLPALLHRVNPERFPAAPSPAAPEPPLPRFETTRALIKVQDGCGFGCAYCIVPRARGRPRSRPRAEILAEVRRLVDAGFREIVLTGANLGSYRDGEAGLPELTDRLEALPGLDRIRLSSIEITTAERAVIERMAASGKLCRFLHIPLQSGDDRILAAMGRRYTAAEYRRLIEYAAARVQPLGLGTDVIVGFPGEDGRAYRNTCALVDDLPFSNLHVFPYSRRPGTPAAEMPGQIPAPLARARVRELLILEARKRAAFAESFVGRRVEVLIERLEPDGTARGWTGEYLEVAVAGAGVRVNDLVTVAVTAAHGGGLRGATG